VIDTKREAHLQAESTSANDQWHGYAETKVVIPARALKNERNEESVAVTPDGAIAFTGTDIGTLVRYDVSLDEEHIGQRVVAEQTVDGKYLSFTGDWSGKVPTLDVSRDPPKEWDYAIGGDINRLGVSPDGQCVVGASIERSITIWQAEERAPRILMWGGGDIFVKVTVNLDRFVATTERRGEIWSGNAQDNSSWSQWNCDPRVENGDRVLEASSSDGYSRLLGTRNGCLIFETRDGETRNKVQAHQSLVLALA
jgi:hypothetical protein